MATRYYFNSLFSGFMAFSGILLFLVWTLPHMIWGLVLLVGYNHQPAAKALIFGLLNTLCPLTGFSLCIAAFFFAFKKSPLALWYLLLALVLFAICQGILSQSYPII